MAVACSPPVAPKIAPRPPAAIPSTPHAPETAPPPAVAPPAAKGWTSQQVSSGLHTFTFDQIAAPPPAAAPVAPATTAPPAHVPVPGASPALDLSSIHTVPPKKNLTYATVVDGRTLTFPTTTSGAVVDNHGVVRPAPGAATSITSLPLSTPVLIQDPRTGQYFETTLRDVQRLQASRPDLTGRTPSHPMAGDPSSRFSDHSPSGSISALVPSAPVVLPANSVIEGSGTRQVKAEPGTLDLTLQHLAGAPSANGPFTIDGKKYDYDLKLSGVSERQVFSNTSPTPGVERWTRSVAVVQDGDKFKLVVAEQSPMHRGEDLRFTTKVEGFESSLMTREALVKAMTTGGLVTHQWSTVERSSFSEVELQKLVPVELAIRGR